MKIADLLPARQWRMVFAAYALVIATLTHWPRLAIPAPGQIRLDTFIHAGVFGLWTILLTFAAFFGPTASTRNRVRSVIAALAYAVVDELTQGIPVLHRTVDPADIAANSLGILGAGAALWLLAGAAGAASDAP